MKLDKNRVKNTLMFEVGVIGIDAWIKDNQGGIMDYFSGSITKAVIYYVILFIIVAVLYNLGLEKMRKYNKH
ncbi:hypothetical protein [Peptostreptococcus anaerobius]|uniref:hypothetical protein n=1 Tax=Peptostreptococcus anaerobius TaxID=1261 RepID=UPI00254E5999|nr:hypothetical protein [Peptostreptococcus anaerobius]MDK8278185.1 hypothetical protein [Peptostreptococcus anaerobius]